MAAAIEVAKYIIKNLPVDNLKLQKLLYYSQAVHLVMRDKKPLFGEAIEAWDYGPVVPPVYREYKHHGFEILPPAEGQTTLSFDEIRAVDMTLDCFGGLTGPALINQTHHEDPWKNAYRSGRPSEIITVESIFEYFKECLDFSDEEA